MCILKTQMMENNITAEIFNIPYQGVMSYFFLFSIILFSELNEKAGRFLAFM